MLFNEPHRAPQLHEHQVSVGCHCSRVQRSPTRPAPRLRDQLPATRHQLPATQKHDKNNRPRGLPHPPIPAQRPSTTSMPERIVSTRRPESFTTCSASTPRSSVSNCETFATESLESRVARAGSNTFPGASAQRRLLVSGTHTTVAIRLLLNESPCTTTTGRRNPRSRPRGCTELGPPNVPLADHQSAASSTRRPASPTKSSTPVSKSAHSASSACRTSSGECRAKYSRSARL